MPFDRGEVVLVAFPNSNLTSAKQRPALVVQSSNLGTGIQQTILAMISSNMDRAGHPSRVTVLSNTPQGRQMGLLQDSVVMTDNLVTVLDGLIRRVLGTCDNMTEVEAALRHTLELQ